MHCRQLVVYMNGTADAETIADPATFFSLLCTFAAGLDAAHADNLAADKVRTNCCTAPVPDISPYAAGLLPVLAS